MHTESLPAASGVIGWEVGQRVCIVDRTLRSVNWNLAEDRRIHHADVSYFILIVRYVADIIHARDDW